MHDISFRASIVVFKTLGYTTKQISTVTGIPECSVRDILSHTCGQGFDPSARPVLVRDVFLQDGARSGRPLNNKDNTESAEAKVSAKVCRNRYG